MYLLVGLGNPGMKYANHRHSVGFMAIDAVRERYGFGKESQKFGGLLSEGSIKGVRVLAFKPLSYMNESGLPVGELLRFYKLALESVTVIHDELDLPHAKIRLKTGGGHGGHNGLKSLDAHISEGYQRIRIGIGHPGDKDLVHNHVLSDFSKPERAAINTLLDEIAAALPMLLAGDAAGFATKVALEVSPKSS